MSGRFRKGHHGREEEARCSLRSAASLIPGADRCGHRCGMASFGCTHCSGASGCLLSLFYCPHRVHFSTCSTPTKTWVGRTRSISCMTVSASQSKIYWIRCRTHNLQSVVPVTKWLVSKKTRKKVSKLMKGLRGYIVGHTSCCRGTLLIQ